MSARKTATLIASSTKWGRGDTRLWRLDPPFEGTSVVVSSAVNLPLLMPGYRTSETMIFPWGEATSRPANMGELSMIEGFDHEGCIRDLGYEVAS